MPISIAKAQQANVNDIGEDNSGFVEFGISKNVFEQYGIEFKRVLGEISNKRNVVASSNLLDSTTFRISKDGSLMQILVPDYYDFPNEGVKGVKDSSNAPSSPYQYKNYGMNAAGRRSIKKYIQEGRAKVSTVVKTKDKALGIGREKKQLSLIDIQTNTLVFLIKKYGIKATHYFTDTLKETFKDFELKMTEALGKDIVFTLEKLNRKK